MADLYSATGHPLVRIYEDRYRCLDDHRLAHPIDQPSCDCMRRRPPALPFRVVGGVLGILGWCLYFGGLLLSTAVSKAGDRIARER